MYNRALIKTSTNNLIKDPCTFPYYFSEAVSVKSPNRDQ